MLQPRVIIFMATYNGQRYLAEQLDSIVAQTHNNWVLCVSDDGSKDDTLQILKSYQKRVGEDVFFIHSGPGNGYAANFLSLLHQQNTKGDYYAYSDQDDIWEPHKLQHAIDWLSSIPADRPALYCSRTKLVDEDLKKIGCSPLFEKTPSFLNALVQNVGGGNTMVFNHTALEVLRAAKKDIPIIAHDWWTYLLISGAGGAVFYDAYPTVYYRQHSANLIGSNNGWLARFNRIQMLFEGRLKQWIDVNTQALLSIQEVLTEDNKLILNQFVVARNRTLIPRVVQLSQLGIYRQTLLGNIGLIMGALLKKI